IGWLVAAVAAVVIALVVLGLFRGQQTTAGAARPPLPVSVQTVQLTPIADRSEALGTLRSRESVAISTTVTEYIDAIHFRESEWVEAGTVLVTLRQREEQAQLAAERENLREQQREVRRLTGLVASRSVPQSQLDERQTMLDTARHRIEEIEARIADRTLRAPFSGLLGLRRFSPGALVNAGDVITTLDDVRIMQLDFQVPEPLLATIEEGQTVIASSAAWQRDFSGVVSAIDSRVNPVDRSITVRADFDNPERKLKPGMLMVVALARNPRDAVVVPEQALFSKQDQHFVWVLDPESRAAPRDVAIGTRLRGRVEIREGLAVGEQLIVEGAGRLRPGQPVVVKEG
ncbi:MAG: efflux RND transporter periplasmic adaptor subunit, partial [Spongiibacteraceae bacterium]|nr:efflux RND transporter periplasmic adaptor subunit [Spongiibacteraceae bacterium]